MGPVCFTHFMLSSISICCWFSAYFRMMALAQIWDFSSKSSPFSLFSKLRLNVLSLRPISYSSKYRRQIRGKGNLNRNGEGRTDL